MTLLSGEIVLIELLFFLQVPVCFLIIWTHDDSENKVKVSLSIPLTILKPGFSLLFAQKHRKDVSNFDKQFTSEKIDLTPTDKLFMMNLDQTEFMGFSFLNPEFVQHV